MQFDLLPCTQTVQELPLLYKQLTNIASSPKYNCKITQEQWYDAAIKKKAIVHFQTLRRSKSWYQESRCKKHAIRSYVEHAKKQRKNWRDQSKRLLLFSAAKDNNGREWLACADCNNKAIYTRRKTRQINEGWILHDDLTNDKNNNTDLFAWIMLGKTQSLATFNHVTNYDNSRYTHTLSTKNVVFMKYSSHIDKQQEENGPEPVQPCKQQFLMHSHGRNTWHSFAMSSSHIRAGRCCFCWYNILLFMLLLWHTFVTILLSFNSHQYYYY